MHILSKLGPREWCRTNTSKGEEHYAKPCAAGFIMIFGTTPNAFFDPLITFYCAPEVVPVEVGTVAAGADVVPHLVSLGQAF